MWWECPELDWRERFKPYNTSRGIRVIPVYYRMVPEKDPERGGQKWYDSIKRQLTEAGRRGDKDFEQEYEINFAAAAGGLVYPRFDTRKHVLLDQLPLQREWTYLRAIDPGVGVTAALIMAITPDGYYYLIAEYYAGDTVQNSDVASAVAHAHSIKNWTQIVCDQVNGYTEENISAANGEMWLSGSYMDPSSWRREGASEDLGSVAQRYLDAGIFIDKATSDVNGGIERVKEFERPILGRIPPARDMQDWKGDGWSSKYVFPHLTYYLKEKKGYQYKDESEKVLKKRDHLMDCERYLCVHARDIPVIVDNPKMTKLGEHITKLKKPRNERNNPWAILINN